MAWSMECVICGTWASFLPYILWRIATQRVAQIPTGDGYQAATGRPQYYISLVIVSPFTGLFLARIQYLRKTPIQSANQLY